MIVYFLRIFCKLFSLNGKFRKENEVVDVNLIFIGITQSCSNLSINCALFYVYRFMSKTKIRSWDSLCAGNLWGRGADGTIKGLKTFSSLSVKCQLQDLLRSRRKEYLILWMAKWKCPSVHVTWKLLFASWCGEARMAGTQSPEPAFRRVTHRDGTQTSQRQSLLDADVSQRASLSC